MLQFLSQASAACQWTQSRRADTVQVIISQGHGTGWAVWFECGSQLVGWWRWRAGTAAGTGAGFSISASKSIISAF